MGASKRRTKFEGPQREDITIVVCPEAGCPSQTKQTGRAKKQTHTNNRLRDTSTLRLRVPAGRESACRTFQNVGGQWVGKTPPRPTLTRLLAPRTPVHEGGGRDRDASFSS